MNLVDVDLAVQLGRLRLPNPILVASGTFGYAREMAGLVDLDRLGGILPKTITQTAPGQSPPRTVETPAACSTRSAWTTTASKRSSPITCPIWLAWARRSSSASPARSRRVRGDGRPARRLPGVAAIELNISCPNVSGGVDFGTDPAMCQPVVAGVREACALPILAKLTPNVTDIASIAQAAEAGGADAISVINTCLGMAVDWRQRRPLLGNVLGGLSGPAIKPIALRAVYQVARAVRIPVVGIGGIATIDDVMEFLVAGAAAVQIGTANFYNPGVDEDARRPAGGAGANSARRRWRRGRHAHD